MEGRDVRFHHLVLSPTRRSKRGLLAGELERTALEVKNARLAIAGETHKLILRLQIISVWGRGGQLSIRCHRLRSTSPTFPHNHTFSSNRSDHAESARLQIGPCANCARVTKGCRKVQEMRGSPLLQGSIRGHFLSGIINLGLAEGWSLERAVFSSALMC